MEGYFGLLQPLMDIFETDVKRIMDIDVCQTPSPTPTPTPNTRITDLMKLIDDYGMQHSLLSIYTCIGLHRR